VHLSVECPGGTGPLVGKPCLGSAGGLYELGFEAKFRQDASEEGLWQLLNSEVVLQLLDSATGLLLGSAPLDLLPLGLGEHHRASGPTATALVDEALLPALEPYRYLPACGAQPHELNVVELRVWGPGGAV
ncbi:hypothetical protein HaLaN_02639, partial [Haematococcus lacustris]